MAKDGGGDLVKAQLFDSMKLYGKHTPSALSFDQARMLFDYGKEIGIEVFFSVFDLDRVEWCKAIGVKQYKVAYGERKNRDLLEALYHTRKHVIISTSRVECHLSGWSYLYCVPKYPTPFANLLFGLNSFGYVTPPYWDGYSDHTIGLDAAKIALARGAQIIEKHFAIDHQTGIDAQWSMIPEELKELKRWERVCQRIL